ncbi:MAG: esterase family protein [Gemmatimonadetes bacterium]|nr:esterase family protein [Gemmatimonadota bacterium]MBK7785065.1 esterase family protein [Gemmatimonadota bacterium]MBK9692345.1 esterase family protein [Gemmatimonadota bacterium]
MARWGELARRGLVALVGAPAMVLGARDGVVMERLPPFESRLLGENRTIDVYLPRGYRDNDTATYPVLYANDGQDMEAVDLRGTLDSLQRTGRMAPAIVVAIHATERVQDYGTAYIPNAQGLGARADLYDKFLLTELMTLIEARYRVATGAEHTAIMGWSLGGLSAFDMAWRHPDRFRTVGVFSGSFWWRTDDASTESRQTSRIMHRRVKETPGHPRLRMWFETGSQDEQADRDQDGVIDAIQDTEELVTLLERKGYRRGLDMVHLTIEGRHDLPTWKRILPEWLVWAFPVSS